MKKVLITGATGMVGGVVLRECSNSDQIDRVVSLSRNYTGIKHEKLEEIIHADFNDYSGLESIFSNVTIAYFCIGVYSGQVSDDLFRSITVDYTKAFADTLKKQSPKAVVYFLSGSGADQKEKSRFAFAKYKGIAENYLINSKFCQLYIFRPGYIYPVEKRKEPNISYWISRKLYPIIKMLGDKYSITSVELGKAMYKAVLSGADSPVLENIDIKNIIKA